MIYNTKSPIKKKAIDKPMINQTQTIQLSQQIKLGKDDNTSKMISRILGSPLWQCKTDLEQRTLGISLKFPPNQWNWRSQFEAKCYKIDMEFQTEDRRLKGFKFRWFDLKDREKAKFN